MQDIVFVLVGAQRAGNIGAAARAIKTMGFSKLRLVDCVEVETAQDRGFAHAATDVLDAAVRYDSLAAAIADCEVAIATTGRRRGKRRLYLRPEVVATRLAEWNGTVALVFGREESGLSNEELDACHLVSEIPMAAAHPSLNLAQAVMVYAYVIAASPAAVGDAWTARQPPLHHPGDAPEATPPQLSTMIARLRDLLPRLGYDRGRALYGRTLERAALLGPGDVRLVHSAITAIEARLASSEDGRAESSGQR